MAVGLAVLTAIGATVARRDSVRRGSEARRQRARDRRRRQVPGGDRVVPGGVVEAARDDPRRRPLVPRAARLARLGRRPSHGGPCARGRLPVALVVPQHGTSRRCSPVRVALPTSSTRSHAQNVPPSRPRSSCTARPWSSVRRGSGANSTAQPCSSYSPVTPARSTRRSRMCARRFSIPRRAAPVPQRAS